MLIGRTQVKKYGGTAGKIGIMPDLDI